MSDIPDSDFDRAKLLLRAAAWVSLMDPSGGKDAARLERRAIAENLERFAREADYKTLLPVFESLRRHESVWDRWAEDLSRFTDELRSVAEIETLEYRQCLYDLAYCVATRYRERNWIVAIFASIWTSLLRFFSVRPSTPSLPAYLNISALEKNALNEIAIAAGLPQRLID
jgi:hypothetical protein